MQKGFFHVINCVQEGKHYSNYFQVFKRRAWWGGVITVTWEAERERILVSVQTGQNVHETPTYPIKAESGGVCLWYYL
jgi:hypothetical protein